MKLSDKILYCRKKAGLSQEALAQKLDVSRQAVSKWETGEATPDLNNLSQLAKAFGVTADWLISDEEPVTQQAETPPPTWLDAVPGFIGRMLKKYGWLFGVYLAISGVLVSVIGAAGKFISEAMMKSFNQAAEGMFPPGIPGYSNPFEQITRFNPVSMLSTVILIIGVIMIVVGIVLAIVLKRRNSK